MDKISFKSYPCNTGFLFDKNRQKSRLWETLKTLLMNILVIYDDTQRILDSLDNFKPDFDFELLECKFATSEGEAKELIGEYSFEHIIIAGNTIDKMDLSAESFVPYNFLEYLRQYDLVNTHIHLVSPDNDFLNKGEYLGRGLKISVKKHLVKRH